MKIENTLQSQIFKTLGILAFAFLVIAGFGVYVIYEARNPLQQAIKEYNQSCEQIYDIRLALERITMSYQLVYKSKLELASTQLEMAKVGSEELAGILDRMIDRNRASRYSAKADIESFRDKFLEVEGRERSAATLFLASKTSAAADQAVNAASGNFENLRSEIATLNEKNLAQYERSLVKTLRLVVFSMLPILLGLLIIPLSTFWAATQKINRDLIGYIRSLYDFSEQNEKNSQELRTSSELMSSASSQQSAAIQQSVASIAQIRIMLAETEAHVREVQTLATQMSDETLKGSEIMERMQKSMIAIEETNSQIASFEEILSSIRGKTQVINDIVFKTQLLSFNASIEAARAGHYGRGFSVVAEEVGKLAMMSGDAAREIDLLLAQSGDRVSNILQSVQDRVVDGRKVSQEAANKFGHLTEKLSAISEKIAQVANATVEQGGGIEQTAKAMDQVSQGAAENKKGAEEVHRVADLVFEMSAKIRAVTSGIRKFVRESKQPAKPVHSEAALTPDVIDSSQFRPRATSVTSRRATLRVAAKPQSVPTGNSAAPPRSNSNIKEISADDPSFRKAGSQE